jgi:ubiquinone/menaquinone biosynthesis C-methylase UbiE
MTILDFAISGPLSLCQRKYYTTKNTNYGLSEAFFLLPVDRFERYAFIINEIRQLQEKDLSVLEIGSGGKGISFFKGLLAEKKCDFTLFDINKAAFINLKTQSVVGDGRKLPFKDKSFDIVVSTDVVEHIPQFYRHAFFLEIKRICKKRILITCPIQSTDGLFKGRTYDIAYQDFYERSHGYKESNTEQHINSIHPSSQEIIHELPGATVKGYKNCSIWLRYMMYSSRPIVRLSSGLLYYFFWKRQSYEKPFWGATISYYPNSNKNKR